jgi:transposase
VAAPDEVRDQVRNLTRMQLLRTCASWRPDTIAYRDPAVATKISLRSLARRVLELGDEIADLDRLIGPLVAELAPTLVALDYSTASARTATEQPSRRGDIAAAHELADGGAMRR